MPTPFHLRNAAGGSGDGKASSNSNGQLSLTTASLIDSQNSNIDIEREDPSKIFNELTEIGHGNFGAVYFVSSFFFFLLSIIFIHSFINKSKLSVNFPQQYKLIFFKIVYIYLLVYLFNSIL
jgi:hypothetical protein